MRVKRSVETASWRTSPTLSSRWSSEITRTCAMSSAASTSRSRAGSVLTDSTGMPSAATSDSATAPSMRSVMLLSRSRNIRSRPAPQLAEVAAEQLDLAGGEAAHLAFALLVAGDQLGGGELLRPLAADRFETGES